MERDQMCQRYLEAHEETVTFNVVNVIIKFLKKLSFTETFFYLLFTETSSLCLIH